MRGLDPPAGPKPLRRGEGPRIHPDPVVPGRASSREPGIQKHCMALDSGSAPKQAHPGMTTWPHRVRDTQPLASPASIIKLEAQALVLSRPTHDPPMSYVEASETSQRKTGQIKLHGAAGFAGMRKAGALVSKCLDELTDVVKPGVLTSRIDDFVREFAFDHGAYPATLMYRGYRYSTCTSINHVVCHGMPGDRALKEGDIVNIDVTFIVEGWYGDSSRMYALGSVARKAERLIEVTYEAMMRGIAAVKPGATTGDIGHAIQSFVEPQGMS